MENNRKDDKEIELFHLNARLQNLALHIKQNKKDQGAKVALSKVISRLKATKKYITRTAKKTS